MTYYHDFRVDLPRYDELGRENDFPDLDKASLKERDDALELDESISAIMSSILTKVFRGQLK